MALVVFGGFCEENVFKLGIVQFLRKKILFGLTVVKKKFFLFSFTRTHGVLCFMHLFVNLFLM